MGIIFDDKRFQMVEVGSAHAASPREMREKKRVGDTHGNGERDLTLHKPR
jgi:hypothetical protein